MIKGFTVDAWFTLRRYVPPPGVLYSIEEFPTVGEMVIHLRLDSLYASKKIREWKAVETMAGIDAMAEAMVEGAKQYTCVPEPKRKRDTIRVMDIVPSVS